VKDLCFQYIREKCTVDDLRLVSKKELTFFTNNIESLLDSLVVKHEEKVDKVYYYSENLELEIAIRCLQMPVLEKKLAGHQVLMSKIYQARNN
jgi:hypothetical protein